MPQMIRCQVFLPIALSPDELGQITMHATHDHVVIEFPRPELPAGQHIMVSLKKCARGECSRVFVAQRAVKRFCSDICQELENDTAQNCDRADLVLPESGEAHNRTDSSAARKCSGMITAPTISNAASRMERP